MFTQLCSARRAFLHPIAVSFSLASSESKPPAAGEIGNVSPPVLFSFSLVPALVFSVQPAKAQCADQLSIDW